MCNRSLLRARRSAAPLLALACATLSLNLSGNMIENLIADSKKGMSLMQSATLRQGQLTREEAMQAAAYSTSHPDHTAFHLLFALRRDYPDIYTRIPHSSRADVLCAALGHVSSLNDWGYLEPEGSLDGEAATALVEIGQEALACLRPLLDDKRSAPLFGSELATLSTTYDYRRADFAYRYAALILGHEPSFDPDPQVRDNAIEQLKQDYYP